MVFIYFSGDNLITGGYDCSLNWFDLELSTKPYKNFKYVHQKLSWSMVRIFTTVFQTSQGGNQIGVLSRALSTVCIVIRRWFDNYLSWSSIQWWFVEECTNSTRQTVTWTCNHRWSVGNAKCISSKTTMVDQCWCRFAFASIHLLMRLEMLCINKYDNYTFAYWFMHPG